MKPPRRFRPTLKDRLPGAERPRRRVKFQSENPFIRRLVRIYGELPVDQLIARWKQEQKEA